MTLKEVLKITNIMSMFYGAFLLRIDEDGNILNVLINTKREVDISKAKTVYNLFSPKERARVMRALAMGPRAKKKYMELDEQFATGEFVDVDVAPYDNELYMFISFFKSNRDREIEYDRYVEGLLNLSEKDPLTQIYNRHGLFERMHKLISFSDPEKRIGIIFADMDNLKKINDTYGHPAGDEAILSVVKILVSTVRQRDIVARIGGDEFAIIVEEISGSKSTAYGLSKRLIEEFEKQSKDNTTTVSIGVHIFKIGDLLNESQSTDEFEKVFYNQLKKADTATYSAKLAGKNQLKVSDEFSNFYKLESKASK